MRNLQTTIQQQEDHHIQHKFSLGEKCKTKNTHIEIEKGLHLEDIEQKNISFG